MPAVLPPGLMARQGQPLAKVLTVTLLAVPLVIATVALIPALAICPFLGADRRRLVIGLLASLRQWTVVLTEPGRPHARGSGRDRSGASRRRPPEQLLSILSLEDIEVHGGRSRRDPRRRGH